MQDALNKIDYSYDGIDDAFPPCDPGIEPFGSRVMVQIRTPKAKTAGGIILLDEVRETEFWNTQIGKVLAVGPLAFKNRDTQQPWVEGAWCAVGDFVRMPKYGGDRWTVKTGRKDEEEAIIVIVNDLDIVGRVTGDPLAIKAFLK